ncbi:MAG: glutathione S-transferase [Polyangiales bacterium]
MTTDYVLYYWPGIPGRGEYVRLVFEDAGIAYEDVAKATDAMERMSAVLDGDRGGPLPFAPPILEMDGMLVSQTIHICQVLSERLGTLPAEPAQQLACAQVGLTIADLIVEAHDTHHPLGAPLYYEDQKDAAKGRAKVFREQRLPKFLGYLERLLERNEASGGKALVGADITYVDLAAYQTLEGIWYAFPNAMERVKSDLPKLHALRDRVAARPKLAAYLASERRLGFNEHGLFRRYPELDPA